MSLNEEIQQRMQWLSLHNPDAYESVLMIIQVLHARQLCGKVTIGHEAETLHDIETALHGRFAPPTVARLMNLVHEAVSARERPQ
jgi:hypothetical protein